MSSAGSDDGMAEKQLQTQIEGGIDARWLAMADRFAALERYFSQHGRYFDLERLQKGDIDLRKMLSKLNLTLDQARRRFVLWKQGLRWVSGVCFKRNKGWDNHHHVGVAMQNSLKNILVVKRSSSYVRKLARKCRFNDDKLLTTRHPWSRLFDPRPRKERDG